MVCWTFPLVFVDLRRFWLSGPVCLVAVAHILLSPDVSCMFTIYFELYHVHIAVLHVDVLCTHDLCSTSDSLLACSSCDLFHLTFPFFFTTPDSRTVFPLCETNLNRMKSLTNKLCFLTAVLWSSVGLEARWCSCNTCADAVGDHTFAYFIWFRAHLHSQVFRDTNIPPPLLFQL